MGNFFDGWADPSRSFETFLFRFPVVRLNFSLVIKRDAAELLFGLNLLFLSNFDIKPLNFVALDFFNVVIFGEHLSICFPVVIFLGQEPLSCVLKQCVLPLHQHLLLESRLQILVLEVVV